MAEKKIKIDPQPELAAFVGIDWADRKHVWCLQAADSRKREAGELEHKVEAVDAWVAELCRRFGYRPIAVAVEPVKGALVFLLNKYECLHIFPVPSTMTAKMREALYPSGAKDDPRDADLLLDILGQHRDKLHRLSPDDETTQPSAESGGRATEADGGTDGAKQSLHQLLEDLFSANGGVV